MIGRWMKTRKAARWLGMAALAGAVLPGAIAFGAYAEQADSEPVSSGGPATLRRLDEQQYKRSIAQIFGSDITVPGRFEPPVREDGLLAIGASKVIVQPAGFEQYSIRAREISADVLSEANRSRYLPCAKSAATA